MKHKSIREGSGRLLFFLLAIFDALYMAAWAQSGASTLPAPQFSGKVDIGGRKLNLARYGAGKPVVVVEAGLGEPAIESHSWDKVAAGICRTHEICLYDRAGLGPSDGVTNASRTSQDLADDLHALLSVSKVPPPYILVGHSVGGFTVRLYANKYPGEVAGVVLVDSSYPEQWSKWLAIFPAPSPGEPESVRNDRTFLESQVGSPAGNPDRLDLTASGRQVLAASDLGNKPLVVVTHSPTWRTDPKLPPDLSDRMEALWLQWQEQLCRLSTRSSHRIASKAGHYIQSEEPQLVIDAIAEVSRQSQSRPAIR